MSVGFESRNGWIFLVEFVDGMTGMVMVEVMS